MKKTLLAATVILFACAPLRADDMAGRLGAGAGVGGGVPLGTTWVNDHADTGLLLGAWLRYGLDPKLSIGLSYDNLGFAKDGIRVQPVLADAWYHFMPGNAIDPNLHLGLGAADVNRDEINHHGVPALKVGAGADSFIGKDLSVGAFLDYLVAAHDSDVHHEVHGFLFGATLGYWFDFGRKESRAAAPQQQAQAAPAPVPVDSDKDGVPDSLDKCPDTPAGAAVDASGCPLDSDKDGVPDYLDKCPNTPAGTAVDASGCPLDSDKDGVPDNLDKCPGTPAGTAVNAMGCPKGEKVSIELLIEFETSKSEVRPQYDDQLRKVADFMKTYPDTKAEIEGHTDSMGGAEANLALSQQRADAVRQALIDRFGVSADRLSAKGYGETKPIADNATPEGRAKNRRVMATFSAIKD